MKARYLAFFSYLGTAFRSSQKVWSKDNRFRGDPESVQGLLELALGKLRPLIYPAVTLSSRTDGGVHALNTAAHFDIEIPGENICCPNKLTYEVNKFFFKNDISISVQKCLRVNDDFNARFHAISRTYLYRLAALKKDVELPELTCIGQYIPIEEYKRCHFVSLRNFDIERLKEGAKYFPGLHDFSSFKKFDKLFDIVKHKHSRRYLESIDIKPGRSIVTNYTIVQDGVFDYWDIELKGRSFVHNQIRRMMGALISVAIGKIPPEEIKVMLQVPSKHSWHSFSCTGPPHGLYLYKVEYKPEDLVFNNKESNNSDKGAIVATNV